MLASNLSSQGSLVLWDGRLPHQNFPNTGNAFRIVHYLNFARAHPDAVQKRSELLQKKLVVMDALGHRDTSFFPSGLTHLGREVLCMPSESQHVGRNADLYKAIKLTFEAGEDEARGDFVASVEKFRRALKRYPGIDLWYDAIFGS